MKYIFDTDPGIDDAIAICLGIKNKLDIIAFTIATGNIPIKKCENNIKVIEEILNINIPIFRGKKENNCQKSTAEFAHGIDGLGYCVYPEIKSRVIERTYAENFIIKAAKKYKDNLTIVCLGPLTNLANAIKNYPAIAKYLKHVVIMGASYNPRSKKDYIEFNFNTDIDAANIVLSSQIEDIKIITHEIGVKSFIEKDYVLNLRNSSDITSRFVGNIAEKYIDFSYEHYKTIGLGTPDPTTVASIIDESIISYIKADVSVTKDGKCIVNKNENSNVQISNNFDLDKFKTLFKKTFK